MLTPTETGWRVTFGLGVKLRIGDRLRHSVSPGEVNYIHPVTVIFEREMADTTGDYYKTEHLSTP